jgi:hypothetical protein
MTCVVSEWTASKAMLTGVVTILTSIEMVLMNLSGCNEIHWIELTYVRMVSVVISDQTNGLAVPLMVLMIAIC